MKKIIFSIVSILMFVNVFSQNINFLNNITKSKNNSDTLDPVYAIYFTDKDNSIYDINNPLEFLSERAIERRNAFNIQITEDDLPVNESYLQLIEEVGGIIKNKSRWLNCAIVYANDSTLALIKEIEKVDSIVYIEPLKPPVTTNEYQNINKNKKSKFDKIKYSNINLDNISKIESDYGVGYDQINQINGIPVHEQGYKGEGIIIAVLDSGFDNVDELDGFSHLFETNRVIFEKDIVDNGGDIYTNAGTHGTSVLSCMAAYLPGEFIGTAPEASYALFRTERSRSELLIEEYNWAIAAEMADSLGADIINTSLSYSTFDDDSMDHNFEDMDGKTCASTIAAKMAIERGIFITVSAGNSNYTSWPNVGTPADAEFAATIGAVDKDGEIAYFSSLGGNYGGFLKPDFVACGVDAAVIRPNGDISNAAGTSFSSPITCGMIACLIQANKELDILLTPSELKNIIIETCDLYPKHKIDYGYGIPNYELSLNNLITSVNDNKIKKDNIIIYPNPVDDILYIQNIYNNILNINIFDINGRVVKSKKENTKELTINVSNLEKGVFFVEITTPKDVKILKFVKH